MNSKVGKVMKNVTEDMVVSLQRKVAS